MLIEYNYIKLDQPLRYSMFHDSKGLNTTSYANLFLVVQYTGMMLLEEMASIFLTPYLLLLVVPKVICCILTFLDFYTIKGIFFICYIV